MKNCRFLFVIIILSLSFSAGAQVNIYPVVLNQDIPEEAGRSLAHKLDYILSANGYGTCDYAERVVMTATLDVTENHIMPSNPPRVTKKLELILKVGDAVEDKVFGSASIPLSGIGTSDNKAFISAISTLKPENKYVRKMFADMDQAIADYYSQNCKTILNKARAMAMGTGFDDAISYLVSVPNVDEACYNACQDLAVDYYAEKVNQSSYAAYSQARAAWTGEKNQTGAKKALANLKQVDPASNIYPEALALWTEISDKLDSDEQEARQKALREYEDKVQFKKSIVDAVKSVGVAYGEHRPQSITKIFRRW